VVEEQNRNEGVEEQNRDERIENETGIKDLKD